LTILLSDSLSLGGHIGGLIGGLIATFVVEELARRRRSSLVPGVAACAVIGVGAVVASAVLVS
jgi:hypothetical protein